MLEKSFADQEFSGDNAYFCLVCKSKVEKAVQQTRVDTLPPYLILTLNRFFFDMQTMTRHKLLTPVQFPIVLSLPQAIQSKDIPSEYDLQSVIIHAVSLYRIAAKYITK